MRQAPLGSGFSPESHLLRRETRIQAAHLLRRFLKRDPAARAGGLAGRTSGLSQSPFSLERTQLHRPMQTRLRARLRGQRRPPVPCHLLPLTEAGHSRCVPELPSVCVTPSGPVSTLETRGPPRLILAFYRLLVRF